MLRMLGNPRRFCDGVTRREALTAGAGVPKVDRVGTEILLMIRIFGEDRPDLRRVVHPQQESAAFARDNAGNAQGMGSRYFTVKN